MSLALKKFLASKSKGVAPAAPVEQPPEKKTRSRKSAGKSKWDKPSVAASSDKLGSIDPERFADLKYWVLEREKIRRAKVKGLPPPWTEDPIIAGTRWCNVRRMDDKVSLWLLDHWYVNKLSPSQAVIAAMMARQFNRPETLLKLSPHGYRMFEGARFEKILSKMSDDGEQIFTGVYIINGGSPGTPKWVAVMNSLKDANKNLKDSDIDTSSMENTWRSIQKFHGIGSFMAGQIVADLRHVLPGTWEDRMRWAPLGPGSARGINVLFGTPDAPISQKLFEARMAVLIKAFRDDRELAAVWRDRKLEAHDLQNCMCESSKYNRLLFGNGHSKNKYVPSLQQPLL